MLATGQKVGSKWPNLDNLALAKGSYRLNWQQRCESTSLEFHQVLSIWSASLWVNHKVGFSFSRHIFGLSIFNPVKDFFLRLFRSFTHPFNIDRFESICDLPHSRNTLDVIPRDKRWKYGTDCSHHISHWGVILNVGWSSLPLWLPIWTQIFLVAHRMFFFNIQPEISRLIQVVSGTKLDCKLHNFLSFASHFWRVLYSDCQN